jgi:pyruvate, water dikinase
MKWIRCYSELGLKDVPTVGGKNASLGEMFRTLGAKGVRVPDGFAVTSQAYWHHLRENQIEDKIAQTLEGLDKEDVSELQRRSAVVRQLILDASLPPDLVSEIEAAYRNLDGHSVAVRSSATAEDLPTASFAGQQESYLHIENVEELVLHVKKCMASLFTSRAIAYREDHHFKHMDIGLSVGVQKMVDSGPSCSGVMFTIDTESGFSDVVSIASIYGLGENIVQGKVVPDEFVVHKPTLKTGHRSILRKTLGSKEARLVHNADRNELENLQTSQLERANFSISDDDVLALARWAVTIEEHYGQAMDIEWAKDSQDGNLYIVQARPETVHSQRHSTFTIYKLEEKGEVLIEGLAVGQSIASGPARVITDQDSMKLFQPGEVLVGLNTDPDWEPIMKKASAIVTEQGGRTSHAAIVARELGIPAVVGAVGACQSMADGQSVTVCCGGGADGVVYKGALKFSSQSVDPSTLPQTDTDVMVNLANPDQAFRVAQLPSSGVGLVRMEFVFASWVGVHPLALTRYDSLSASDKLAVEQLTAGYSDKTSYFVDRLSQGIATIAGAFYPRPVILRFSDFKTNEYRNLLGGSQFEPEEENPMLGWRGASRYYHPEFIEGFKLEMQAVKKVREEMGLTNLKVMIPFCRTPEEGQKVLDTLAAGGLKRGEDGLEVYVMAELPSNVLQADDFAKLFDGFSIGSNDLTQLILGVDRDSARVSPIFDERNEGVKRACTLVIESAKKAGIKVGICGQAPSDFPDFAAFLVERGIDSISLTPDAILPTTLRIAQIEEEMKVRA